MIAKNTKDIFDISVSTPLNAQGETNEPIEGHLALFHFLMAA